MLCTVVVAGMGDAVSVATGGRWGWCMAWEGAGAVGTGDLSEGARAGLGVLGMYMRRGVVHIGCWFGGAVYDMLRVGGGRMGCMLVGTGVGRGGKGADYGGVFIGSWWVGLVA
ncbi:hypothetical protein Tco_0708215 [Tanacetum coccineum]